MEVQFAHLGVEAFGQSLGSAAQHLAEGIVRRGAVAKVTERRRIFLLMIGKHGHLRADLHVADHGQYAYQKDILEPIADCVACAEVLDFCQQFQKSLDHSRASCRCFLVFLRIVPQKTFLR